MINYECAVCGRQTILDNLLIEGDNLLNLEPEDIAIEACEHAWLRNNGREWLGDGSVISILDENDVDLVK